MKRTTWSARELELARQLADADVCYSCIARILNARFHGREEKRNRHSVRGVLGYYYELKPRQQRGNGMSNLVGSKSS